MGGGGGDRADRECGMQQDARGKSRQQPLPAEGRAPSEPQLPDLAGAVSLLLPAPPGKSEIGVLILGPQPAKEGGDAASAAAVFRLLPILLACAAPVW